MNAIVTLRIGLLKAPQMSVPGLSGGRAGAVPTAGFYPARRVVRDVVFTACAEGFRPAGLLA